MTNLYQSFSDKNSYIGNINFFSKISTWLSTWLSTFEAENGKNLSTPRLSSKKGVLIKTRSYTRQHQSRAGGQGQYSSRAGAVTQI